MFRIFIILFLISFIKLGLVAQEEFVISGTIKDVATGEDLIGATIVVDGMLNTGTISNSYGFFSITLLENNYKIRFQYVGYETQFVELSLTENKRLDIELKEITIELGNIVVTGERADKNVTSVEMGNVKLTPKQVESIPVLFGEQDILKTVQLTPGVKPAGEGNSGFYVRGGGIDQNLILLDEAPVYNASHLLGFFSVFNSEAIKSANLMKGSIPAEFGGRASSVFDIKMKDGNMKKYGVSGNVGLISSSVAVEGPIVKDKGSFIVSGRRTYADMFLVFSKNEDIKQTTLYFYDLNLKSNYDNKLYLLWSFHQSLSPGLYLIQNQRNNLQVY